MDKLRILILPPSDYLGHPNPCRIHHIFEQFPSFGDEVYVVNFSIQNRIVRKSKAVVLSIGDIPSESLSKYYLLNIGTFASSVPKAVTKYDIDTVILANLLPPYLVYRLLPKNVRSVVDLVDHYPTVAAENVPKIFPKRVVNRVFSFMMGSVIRSCDSAVACSYMLANYAKSEGAKKVNRIPNGVEDFFFSDYREEASKIREKLGLEDADLSVCFVGNVEYWLSMVEFMEALYMVKKHTSKKIKFCIVGGKLTTNYLDRIDSQVKVFGLSDTVVKVGFVPHRDVPKYIAAADLCISPKNPLDPVSYYSSPVKVWEYLAQAKPVISTPIPEILLCARDFVSIANTREDYFRELMAFLDNPDILAEKAKRGRAMIREYTWQKVAKSYRELLFHLSSN